MTNDVNAFVSWVEQFAARLPNAISSEIVIGPPSDNNSARITLEDMDGRLGRLIFHERGGATATIYDQSGDLIDISSDVRALGGWENIPAHRFDDAFEPFTSQFLDSGFTS